MRVFSIILIVVVVGILLVLVITQGIRLVKDIVAYVKKRKEIKKNKNEKEN